ncbi:hypothetical protein B5807_00817 [Epicoccum nigrum]|uniref:Uncharacterized protein n=1 Tax=Epicoccum nigrum TaxID=105696 RepID=A0A1Y2MGB0_EPING|nr:hypothetical protein B5807_00817 [Epicoccum nigrum]
MARLHQPADSSHTTPVADHKSDSTADDMSSPALHPLPPSPASSATLSPADCRTLEKILRDVSEGSAVQSTSSSGLAEQLAEDDARSADMTGDLAQEDTATHAGGGEFTDTGYKADDDSLELSEGTTAHLASFSDLDSPLVSKAERRLQDSASMHDERDRQRYHSYSWATKFSRAKRSEEQHKTDCHAPSTPYAGAMNLPDKRANFSQQKCGVTDPCLLPEDNKQREQTRLSVEKSFEEERIDYEQSEQTDEPGLAISHVDMARVKADNLNDSELDGFDADKEDTPQVTGPQRRKIWQRNASRSKRHVSSVLPSSFQTEDAPPAAPSTVTATYPVAERTDLKASVSNQNIPDTPFTKTLKYYKQHNGLENTPIRHRRTTALPEEIAEVTELAIAATTTPPPHVPSGSDATRAEEAPVKSASEQKADPVGQFREKFRLQEEADKKAKEDTDNEAKAAVEHLADSPNHNESQSLPSDRNAMPKTSALNDMQELVCPGASEDVADVHKEGPYKMKEQKLADLKNLVDQREAEAVSAVDDLQKQLIRYPQHPPFVTAIGMIPATMFWVTAAPIVKYTGIAIDVLVDKLREIYL